MNLTKPVLGTLTVMFFLLTSISTYAQVTSFVSEAEAVAILNSVMESSETELSSLVAPVQQPNQSQQDFETELEEFNAARLEVEFKYGASAKMLRKMSSLGSASDLVKASLVSLLEDYENSTIDIDTYAFENQSLSQYATQINDYVLDLLGE